MLCRIPPPPHIILLSWCLKIKQFYSYCKCLLFRSFEYTIKAGNNAGHFVINKNTGEVRTRVQLDRETTARYTLVIIAQDVNLRCHKGRTELNVNVGDINDNSPTFNKNPYQFSVTEDKAVNYVFGLVSATDRDVGSNGKLRYSIISGAGKDDFRMEPETGRIGVARALDFETRSRYVLSIFSFVAFMLYLSVIVST